MTDKPDGRSPREAILARRAMFLSTAMAALGCNTTAQPAPPATSGTAASIGSSPTVSVTAAGSAIPVAPRAPFEQVLAKRPPNGVPDGLSEAELRQLNSFVKLTDKRYQAVGKVWRQLPSCDPQAPACEPTWAALMKDARAMYRLLDGNGVPSCDTLAGYSGSHRQRERGHSRYLKSLVKRIEAHLGAVAKSYSFGSERRAQEMLSQAKKPPPMPCLEPCWQPPVRDIVQVVAFEYGKAGLRHSEATVKAALSAVLAAQTTHGNRAVLTVRGHADAAETDGVQLAEARAKAVMAWLSQQGIAAAQLKLKVAATDYPVARSSGPHKADNTRVDFTVAKQR